MSLCGTEDVALCRLAGHKMDFFVVEHDRRCIFVVVWDRRCSVFVVEWDRSCTVVSLCGTKDVAVFFSVFSLSRSEDVAFCH